MNQTQYVAANAGKSQADRILGALRHAAGWAHLPDLVKASGAYAVHSRIADLRKRGHRIEHESVHRGRAVHSFYRLIE
jgi:hypothetical protein